MVKRQAQVITLDYENELWDKGLLGEHDADTLRNTVLFLIGINCILRAGDEHYYLHRDMPDKPSQLQFKINSKGEKCLVYTEDTVTKANDGGLANMKTDRKVVWVYPSKNINRCPVRLVEKYIKLCPPFFKKSNFYLQSHAKPYAKTWYANQVVGQNSLAKVIKTMLHDARIDGFFTGHSLRRSGTTRLFQADVDRKLIKEMSGHRSDVVDCYTITSDEQRAKLSAIIGGENESNAEKEKKNQTVRVTNGCDKNTSTETERGVSLSQVTIDDEKHSKMNVGGGQSVGDM